MFCTGPWTKEEEDELIKIMMEMTPDGGGVFDEVFWTEVSQRMKHKRSRQQCRIKWLVIFSAVLAQRY